MDKDLLLHLNINSIKRELRRDALLVKNRLQSILHDARFVESLVDIIGFPLVPNERCGLWYVDPSKSAETAYFKSTDGHMGQWSFLKRRLNLHLLALLGKSGGLMVVDSTRKGKLMPDALLKTVPIWCAVLNSILLEDITEDAELLSDPFITQLRADNWLLTPREMVSPSEHSEMCKRIPDFVKEVKKLGLVTRERILRDMGSEKPIVPEWWYPGCKQLREDFYFAKEGAYFTLSCVTASKRTIETSNVTVRRAQKTVSWPYVQGAADDHELWATEEVCGGDFLAQFAWKSLFHSAEMIDPETGYLFDWFSEDDVLERINTLYEKQNTQAIPLDISFVKRAGRDTGLALGKISLHTEYSAVSGFQKVVVLSEMFRVQNVPEKDAANVVHFALSLSKKGAKQLRETLPVLVPQLEGKTLVLCDTGSDLSVGVVLALLCTRFNLQWEQKTPEKATKDTVRQHLALLLDVRKVNPSRNTLQSVNTYVM